MKNLKRRISFWSSETRLNNFDSNWISPKIIEVMDDLKIFQGKNVLEIGPGVGRQFTLFKDLAKSYDLADISSDVLSHPRFLQNKRKVLTSWSDRLKVKYDIITFWFVIHHVRKDEIGAMIKFLHRHLRQDGLVIFNSPLYNRNGRKDRSDGIHTTRWRESEVISHFSSGRFLLVEGPIEHKKDEFLIMKR